MPPIKMGAAVCLGPAFGVEDACWEVLFLQVTVVGRPVTPAAAQTWPAYVMAWDCSAGGQPLVGEERQHAISSMNLSFLQMHLASVPQPANPSVPVKNLLAHSCYKDGQHTSGWKERRGVACEVTYSTLGKSLYVCALSNGQSSKGGCGEDSESLHLVPAKGFESDCQLRLNE